MKQKFKTGDRVIPSKFSQNQEHIMIVLGYEADHKKPYKCGFEIELPWGSMPFTWYYSARELKHYIPIVKPDYLK